jgi:predicted nucleotide-binding protein
MAKKKTEPPTTTELVVELSDADTQLRDRVEKGRTLLEKRPTSSDELDALRQQYYTWDEYNTALLGRLFSTPELAQEYSYWGIGVVGGPTSLAMDTREFVEDVTSKVRRLESIIERLPLYTTDRGLAPRLKMPARTGSPTRNVFVVHGRNNELKETVARYLAQLDLSPIILHEQASAGRTIIEKFEANSDACFAVVVLTPDDVGCLATPKSLDDLHKRARQNVIFEWGFFVAALGRRHVCALVAEGVEIPSDTDGIVYVPLDQVGAWKMLLARELKAGGVEVDLNRAI